MNAWELYWLIKLDAIGTAAIPFAILGGISTLILSISGAVCKTEGDQKVGTTCHHFLGLSIPLFVIFLAIAVLLPTTKQMCAIIVVPKVINAVESSEQLKALPGKVLDLADEWVNKLSPAEEDTTDAD